MRIDRLNIQNFKKFESQTFTFHSKFTLLVGENGSGKTTVLDALAVSLGIWLVDVPDSYLMNSRRNIEQKDIRLEASQEGDRIQFRERLPVRIEAEGQIGDHSSLLWTRKIDKDRQKTSNTEANEALRIIKEIYQRDSEGEHVVCPVLAYYGAGRAWSPSNKQSEKKTKNIDVARRWSAFYDCLNERIRFDDLHQWFRRETTAAGNLGGRMRPGFEIVKRAVLFCVPEADGIEYDPDREQIILKINGMAQPFNNLSAGQKMMLALVADIAIKAVIQNAFMIPPDNLGSEDEPLPRLLKQTPGMVLIDELDVHLHPKWQRRVAEDLKKTFPSIQFVCTSHSPQIIGELPREEIRILEDGYFYLPNHSYGVDSNRVLEEIMGAAPRAIEVSDLISKASDTIDKQRYVQARQLLEQLKTRIGDSDPEIIRLQTLIDFFEDTE